MFLTLGKRKMFVLSWGKNKLNYKRVRNGKPYGATIGISYKWLKPYFKPHSGGAIADYYQPIKKEIVWEKLKCP